MKLTKKNFYGLLGMSSGLFVGCPTCAGSFFYSLAGFSSLITFSALSLYQIVFIIISVPLLILSVIAMAKLSQKKFLDSCKIR
jgi:NADH:ubiquinone oxidoreductase subunit 6 (subunit J)